MSEEPPKYIVDTVQFTKGELEDTAKHFAKHLKDGSTMSEELKPCIEMTKDMETIDSHFQVGAYVGDMAVLPISDLAKFITFYQPATSPVTKEDAERALEELDSPCLWKRPSDGEEYESYKACCYFYLSQHRETIRRVLLAAAGRGDDAL